MWPQGLRAPLIVTLLASNRLFSLSSMSRETIVFFSSRSFRSCHLDSSGGGEFTWSDLRSGLSFWVDQVRV
jgi:hypothetical protein